MNRNDTVAGEYRAVVVYRRGKSASAGGGVVGVPLGGRRTGNTGGAMESGRALPCYWMVGGVMKCE